MRDARSSGRLRIAITSFELDALSLDGESKVVGGSTHTRDFVHATEIAGSSKHSTWGTQGTVGVPKSRRKTDNAAFRTQG